MAEYRSEFKPGQMIGSCELKQFIGACGFTETWKARHAEISGDVLLKILAVQDYNKQFRQKMYAQSKFDHPAILQVTNLQLNGNPPHAVLDDFDGESLAYRLRVRGVLPEDMVLAIAKQVLEALLYAHNRGVHHQNLHLDNIFTDSRNHVKVTDFGLDFPRREFTAPEQKPGRRSDLRSDLYSVGAIMVKLLTGFDVQSIKIAEIKKRGVSTETIAIIVKSLAKKNKRYQRASEMLEDVNLAVSRHGRKSGVYRNERAERRTGVYPEERPAVAAAVKQAETNTGVVPSVSGISLHPDIPRAKPFLHRFLVFIMFMLIGVIAVLGIFRAMHTVKSPEPPAAAVIPASTVTPRPLPTLTPQPTVTPKPTATITPSPTPTKAPVRKPSRRKPPAVSKPYFDIPRGFVYVRPGAFYRSNHEGKPEMTRGSKIQRIWVTHGFFMAESEVTQEDWTALMGGNPSQNRGRHFPVESVSWYEAVDFCNRKSLQENLKPCYTFADESDRVYVTPASGDPGIVQWNHDANGYRLPTEAEWEYACRAGTQTRFSWGDYGDCNRLMAENDTVASEDSCAKLMRQNNLPTDSPIAVKSYPPNPWKLYDMHGNVQEWCWDWYAGRFTREYNPEGPSTGTRKVVRGGSWNDPFSRCTSSARDSMAPADRSFTCGFRIVRNAP